jgi:hypothetical protein
MSQERNNQIVKWGGVSGVLFTLVVFPGLYFLLPHFHQELGLPERLELGVGCLFFPGLFLLLLIIRIGSQRFGTAAEDPTKVLASSEAMKIDLRVLSNSHEQLLLFVINTMGLAVLLPFAYLSVLPIYSGLFVVGRLVFWAGYRHHVLWRAPGFCMSVVPAALGLLYCCATVLVRFGGF